jgi:2-polyprenyl-3-methyl-5-hydroxy-6-metoxy-1,4-benzoquinol methylase
MNPTVKKVLSDPVGALRRTVDKLVIGPMRYRKGKGYDAHAYWSDRFKRHGTSLRGPGDEGLSEADNDREYQIASEKFHEFCRRNAIAFADSSTLEIGVGTGFYTRQMVAMGAEKLTGIDITNVLFDDVRRELPSVELRQGDVTKDPIDGTFDTAVMIDVIEHIVTDDAFDAALRNVGGAVSPTGTFILGPVLDQNRRHLYYVKFWTEADALAALPGWNVADSIPFRTGRLLLLRRDT